jgi:PAS domain S-box-containing protein
MFRTLFERSAMAMLLADDARRYRDANPAACSALDLSRTEITRLRIDDLTPPEFLSNLEDLWRAFLRDGTQSGRFPLRLPDGRNIEIAYSSTANIKRGLHLCVFPPPDAEHADIEEAVTSWASEETERDRAGASRLTPREREVVALLALGLNGVEIAERLVLSPETVRVHIRNARRKLGARTRAHVIALALQSGELTLRPNVDPN